MEKIKGWESVEAERGGFQTITAGGYVCKVLNAGVQTSRAGNQMLVLLVDIEEGPFKGYYRRKWEYAKKHKADAKYPNAAIYRQVCEGEQLGRFKGLIMSFEESNPGFKWDWDESKLKGLKIGGVFAAEEFRGTDGAVHESVKVYDLRPLNDPDTGKHISEINPPKTKKLQEEEIPFGGTHEETPW